MFVWRMYAIHITRKKKKESKYYVLYHQLFHHHIHLLCSSQTRKSYHQINHQYVQRRRKSMTSTKSKRAIIIRILVAISILMLIVNIIYRIAHPMTGVASMYSPSGLQFHCCIAAVILSLTLKKKGKALLIACIPVINALTCINIFIINSIMGGL